MDVQPLEYQGYRILVTPSCGHDGLWHGGYQISKDHVTVSTRNNIFPGFAYREAAYDDSIEHAKLEVENHIAAEKNKE